MPQALSHVSDNDLIGRLAQMAPTNAKAMLCFQALTDDGWFDAVAELRRRYRTREIEHAMIAEEASYSPSGRLTLATSVEIDALRWKLFWHTKRVKMVEVSASIGRSGAWANAIANKGRCSMQALDELASEWDLSLEDLVRAVCSDRERSRWSFE